MKIVAIIQARFTSTRLPGKVLLPLCRSTVLGQVVARVRRATRLSDVWIATSTSGSDDAVADEARRIGVQCHRGELDDVLARYHDAALVAGADVIVRVTADCPLFDGALLDEMLDRFTRLHAGSNGPDYLSNVIERTYPRGLDAEVFTFATLARAHQHAVRAEEREHVTPYIYGHPALFSLVSHTQAENLSAHRWTLDTPADWAFIQGVYSEMANDTFDTGDVLALLERNPSLRQLNAHVEQRAVAR